LLSKGQKKKIALKNKRRLKEGKRGVLPSREKPQPRAPAKKTLPLKLEQLARWEHSSRGGRIDGEK